MYERSAIVLERYFNKIFGYDMQNNLKTNFNDYCNLVESLEKYKDVSEEEEKIMQEYDSIANNIRDIQKTQENLYKKNKIDKLLQDSYSDYDEINIIEELDNTISIMLKRYFKNSISNIKITQPEEFYCSNWE